MHENDDPITLQATATARHHVHAAHAAVADVDASLQAARTALEQALTRRPRDVRLLTCLGAVACDQGEHHRASELLTLAVALGSQDRNTFFNLGVALLNSGCADQARARFAEARAMKASGHTWEAYFDPQAH